MPRRSLNWRRSSKKQSNEFPIHLIGDAADALQRSLPTVIRFQPSRAAVVACGLRAIGLQTARRIGHRERSPGAVAGIPADGRGNERHLSMKRHVANVGRKARCPSFGDSRNALPEFEQPIARKWRVALVLHPV